MVESKTFRYYAISLNYMFVNEFCKLFESNNQKDQNVASLYRWLDYLKGLTNATETIRGLENQRKKLDIIKNTSEFKILKDYRNERFSHIDGQADPFNLPVLGKENLIPIKEMLKSINQFVGYATSIEGPGLIYDHVDNRTDNFIVYHSRLWKKNKLI